MKTYCYGEGAGISNRFRWAHRCEMGLGQVRVAGGGSLRTLLETYYDPIPAVTAGVSKPFFLAVSSSS